MSTIGVDFMQKNITIQNYEIGFSIWDFAGEKKFRQLLPAYCSGASGALLCFDLTNAESLEDLAAWNEVFDANAPGIVKILVGTKADLVRELQVPKPVALDVMDRYGMSNFFETSSKNGQNVEEVFQALGENIIENSLHLCPYCEKMVPRELIFCQYCGKKILNLTENPD
jgi:small GTP-binding protein